MLVVNARLLKHQLGSCTVDAVVLSVVDSVSSPSCTVDAVVPSVVDSAVESVVATLSGVRSGVRVVVSDASVFVSTVW